MNVAFYIFVICWIETFRNKTPEWYLNYDGSYIILERCIKLISTYCPTYDTWTCKMPIVCITQSHWNGKQFYGVCLKRAHETKTKTVVCRNDEIISWNLMSKWILLLFDVVKEKVVFHGIGHERWNPFIGGHYST